VSKPRIVIRNATIVDGTGAPGFLGDVAVHDGRISAVGQVSETGEQEILIRFADERRSVSELEDLIVVAGKSGAEIRLGDLAVIEDVFEDRENQIQFNGMRAGILEITKTKAEDTLTVFDAVKTFIDKERLIQPPDVKLVLTQDMSSIVRDRLEMLVKNALQGLVLVFLTMFLFFNLRLSWWVAAGLPVSFFGGGALHREKAGIHPRILVANLSPPTSPKQGIAVSKKRSEAS
jgi:multidrug efflux pump subunit AcrB